MKKPKGTTITYAILDKAGVTNVGDSVVVYDRTSRTALFYRLENTGYKLILTRNKRKGHINVRPTDALLSVDFDGTVTKGDTYDVFNVTQPGDGQAGAGTSNN